VRVHAVSRASFPLTLPSPARGEGEKKHENTPVPFFPVGGRVTEKISPGPFGPGLTLRHVAAGSGEGLGPSRRIGRSARAQGDGAGPIRASAVRPTRGVEAATEWLASGGPFNLARGRQRVRSLFSCPSRPPLGAVVLASAPARFGPGQCTGGSGLFQPPLSVCTRSRKSNREAIAGEVEARGLL